MVGDPHRDENDQSDQHDCGNERRRFSGFEYGMLGHIGDDCRRYREKQQPLLFQNRTRH